MSGTQFLNGVYQIGKSLFAIFGVISLYFFIVRYSVRSDYPSNRATGVDTHQIFRVAYLKTTDGRIKIPVKSWRDYGDRCVQIVDTNDVAYLSCYENILLVEEDIEK